VILLFYAFGREVNALKRRLKACTALQSHGLHGFSGKIGAIELAAVATGIGPLRAREAARRAFEKLPRPERVISTGVAGALSKGLAVGDLVVVERFVFAESSGGNRIVTLPCSHLGDAERALRLAGMGFATGAMLTSHRALATGEEKRRAKTETGAIAVDMESAAIAAEALARDLPFVCIRSVLDTVDEEIFAADLADEHGRVQPRRAAQFLVRNPAAIFRIPRMMRNLARASKSLADAIEALSRSER
jgi:adenosylhomocysteine nucleosidase